MAEESRMQNTDAEQTQERRRRVGDILRGERLARDLDLNQVAEQLCIRRAFLEAIENSRYQDLPGTTYALGFVRTYAEHLKLDAKSLVEQYKVEADELEQQTKLHFPEPLPAKSLPGGALVFIGLLLLAVFYGIWWYLNNQGKSVTDLIPAVPEQFSELLEDGEAEPTTGDVAESPAPATSEMATTAAPSDMSGDAAEMTSQTSDAAADTASATAEMAAEAPATDETASATSGSAEVIVENAQDTATTAADQATTTVETQAAGAAETAQEATAETQETVAAEEQAPTAADNQEAVATPTQDQVQEATAAAEETAAAQADTPTQAATASPAPQPQPGTNNKVFGEDNADARVVITAKSTAWVEITGPDGKRLLTRLMNKGDQYRVPNMQGVTLVTGNAGALEISVDGKDARPLGPVGAVRRDVSLNPEAILANQ